MVGKSNRDSEFSSEKLTDANGESAPVNPLSFIVIAYKVSESEAVSCTGDVLEFPTILAPQPRRFLPSPSLHRRSTGFPG